MAQFHDDCPWPRRLLYIPSMTSYEWRTEDWYGPFQRPKYNVLSYTWGRWEIKDPAALTHVRAIKVHDILWDVPRIKPEQEAFTDDEFLAVIQNTTFPHPEVAVSERVDFLWLDVACIHQSDEDQKAREVGRQARIFRGATYAYIWIRESKTYIRQWTEDFDNAFRVLTTPEFQTIDHESWILTVIDLLQRLFSNAWFSSLWTLQEAFLRPTATLIFKDAEKEGMDHCTLSMISDALAWIETALTSNQHIRQLNSARRLKKMINDIGFVGRGSKNPMALLTASHARTTRLDEDRVYGIMQVFEVSVGKSRADRRARDHEYTLDELEEELGAAILVKHPVLSQLHVHTTFVPFGRSWRFSRHSVVPESTKILTEGAHEALSVVAHLSVCRIAETVLVSQFSGKVAEFRQFASRFAKDWPNSWNLKDTSIYLDAMDDADAQVNSPHPNDGTLKKAAWLVKHMSQTHILLLALKRSDEPAAPAANPWCWALGVLMCPAQIPVTHSDSSLQVWKRQGIFIWSTSYSRMAATASPLGLAKALLEELESLSEPVFKSCPYLIGGDGMWDKTEGYLG